MPDPAVGQPRRLTFRRLLGPGPLRPAAAADGRGPAAAALDDPQRDRLRAPGADPRVPGGRALRQRESERARRGPVRGRRLGRLRRWHRRARDRPVQPPGSADGPCHRSPAGDLGGRRVLALPAAAALGAGGADRARARDARARSLRPGARRGAAHQLAGAPLGGAADGGVLLRDARPGRVRRGAAVHRPRAGARGVGAVRTRRPRQARAAQHG